MLRFAAGTGFLAFALTGCSKSNYETFEECELNELHKLSSDGQNLSPDARGIIMNFCLEEESKRNQNEQDRSIRRIELPKWEIVSDQNIDDDGNRRFIDVNNIETNVFQRKFWIKKLTRNQNIDGNSFEIARMHVDCSRQTARYLSYEKFVNGESTISQNDVWAEEVVRPDSRLSYYYNFVCTQDN
jgi:adenine-specific DNA methylase